jgi:hypothetical protein
MSDRSRAALFVAACAALIAAALLLPAGNPGAAPEQRHLHAGPSLPARPIVPTPTLASSARRFLAAFLRYEVGDSSPALTRALEATATRALSAELLRHRPRPSQGQAPSDPTLGPLSFAPVSTDPPLVSVSGTARRPTGPEQLSFVFEFSQGSWLASAPGE